MKNLILLLFIHSMFCIYAQEPVSNDYKWGEIPKVPEGVDSEKIILKNIDIVEFIFEGERFMEYQTSHLIEFINSNEQVQRNNKRYVPFNENSELVEAKIRVINSNNEVIELDKSKILTAIDENTKKTYKYFALEGLEKGSIIDYYYVVKKYPDYNGTRKYIQDEFFTKEYKFELYCPSHLEFAFKVYNDSSQVYYDSLSVDKNHWILQLDNIDALKEEDQSLYNTLLKQIVYKLNNNKANNTRDLSSFGVASTNVYNKIYSELDKQDIKAINSFYKELDFSNEASVDDKISEIESLVKDNINLVNNYDKQFTKISSIVKLKSATKIGMIRLMIRLFEEANIKFQIVLTSDRTNCIFDKDFESFNSITDYLIYFSETKKFLTPNLFEYRYGIIPWEFTDNNGLFIKEISIGDYKAGIGKVKYIPPLDYNISYHGIDAYVKFGQDFINTNIELKSTSAGYYALAIQPYYDLINEETKENLIIENFKQFYFEGKINEWRVKNGSVKYVGKKPFIEEYNVTTNELIDKAGDKYLFKIGKLIGRQTELYSEVERKLPVNTAYKRKFIRKFIIEIPENYYVKNIKDLKVYVDYELEGEKVMLFESNYRTQNEKIIVDVNEYYDKIGFSLKEYDIYRKVVNSAADFEKITLIFEKE